MADTKVSALASTTLLVGADFFYVVDATVDSQISFTNFLDSIEATIVIPTDSISFDLNCHLIWFFDRQNHHPNGHHHHVTPVFQNSLTSFHLPVSITLGSYDLSTNCMSADFWNRTRQLKLRHTWNHQNYEYYCHYFGNKGL